MKKRLSLEHRRKISEALKKRGIVPPSRKGVPVSEETRIKLSEATKRNTVRYWLGKRNPYRTGKSHELWKGGVTPWYKKVRKSLKYVNWRKSVFERDSYTCIACGVVGGKLEADHIKPFSQYPELRFDLSNGRTLCQPCHRNTDTWGVNVPKYLKTETVTGFAEEMK